MNVVLAVGVCSIAAAVLLAWLSARLSTLAAAAGCVLIGVVGPSTAGGLSSVNLSIGGWLGFGHAAMISDRVAGIFLSVVGVTGAAVSAAMLEHPPRRLIAALHALLLVAVVAVIGANQGFLFLLAWETITLTLYLLGSVDRDNPRALVAGYFAGVTSKIGGAALLAAFALLYARTGSFAFNDWLHAAGSLGVTRDVVFVLLLIAFGTKIGTIPFQGPLPPLYRAAPGTSAATISIAFNAAFYGLWRLVYEMLGKPPLWWGEVAVVVGALTALIGILYAVGQEDIRRFLGFSSVEHGGIVLVGFGVALVGHGAGQPDLAAAGLLAATLHLVMHGVAKALALLGAERIEQASGHTRLAPLGGLATKLPRTGVGFGLAVLTLAAMPPFGGFVSEWFTLEALLQAFRLDNTVAQLVLALGAALLALTAGIGLLAFAKLYGGIFLGRARSALTFVRESPLGGTGFAALAVIALALGVIAPWEIRWLGVALRPLLGFDLATTTISSPLVFTPVYRGFSVLAPTWIAAGLVAFGLVTAAAVRVVLRPAVRRAPVWTSGTAVPVAEVQYTPAAYANPIRVVLAGLYGFARTTVAGAEPNAPRVLQTRVIPAFEHYLYRPLTAGALLASSRARRLQSGRLGFYLLYVLLVLLAVLALIPVLKD